MSCVRIHFHGCLRRAWRFFLFPLLFYSASFFLLTFPLILKFNRVFFTDREDGYQMIWDLWWVRRAITVLHQNPFYTDELYFPRGTSLVLHSLGPVNGLISIPLTTVFSDIQSFNLLVISAFVGSGLTAFWLCWKCTRVYWPSLAGGFAFAFCSYRWAHYHGHLPLISTEMIPLYLLGLLSIAATPRIGIAISAALALLGALLSDPYQFLYCVLATIIVLLWLVTVSRSRRLLLRRYIPALLAFSAATILTSGPIVLAMMRAVHSPQLGMHDPEMFSADLLGPWVPDWTWLYNDLTRAFWLPLEASYIEKSVCIGPAVVVAVIWGLARGRRSERFALGSAPLFLMIAITFIALSFGPTWKIWTIPVTRLTPYRALAALLPPLRFAGCTGRMMIMAQLSLCVLAAAGLSRIAEFQSSAWRVVIIIMFSLAWTIESQPRVLLTCPPDAPRWVTALRDAPGKGAVIDLLDGNESIDFYYQTIHHRPIDRANISRLSADTAAASDSVLDAANRGQYDSLARMGFSYIVVDANAPRLPLPRYYADQAASIYCVERR